MIAEVSQKGQSGSAKVLFVRCRKTVAVTTQLDRSGVRVQYHLVRDSWPQMMRAETPRTGTIEAARVSHNRREERKSWKCNGVCVRVEDTRGGEPCPSFASRSKP